MVKGRASMNPGGPLTQTLWWIRDTLKNYLPATFNRLEVAYEFAGTNGEFTSENTVTGDAYIVIQPVNDAKWKNPDGTLWQAVLAVNTLNTAARVGSKPTGIAIPRQALRLFMCPTGGWDNNAGNFGSNALAMAGLDVFSYTTIGNTSPLSVVSLLVTCSECVVAGAAKGLIVGIAGKVTTSLATKVFHGIFGHFQPHVTADPMPCAAFTGTFALHTAASLTGGYVPNPDASGVNAASLDGKNYGTSYGYSYGINGSWIGRPMEVMDSNVVNARGYVPMPMVAAYNLTDGSPDGTGLYFPFNGLLYPIG